MNRLFDRVVSLCGLYVLLAAFCVAQFVHAQDELPCPPPVGGKVQFGDHPIFSKLPLAADYLHRVVANDKGEVIIYLTKMPQAGDAPTNACGGPGTCADEASCPSPVEKNGDVLITASVATPTRTAHARGRRLSFAGIRSRVRSSTCAT